MGHIARNWYDGSEISDYEPRMAVFASLDYARFFGAMLAAGFGLMTAVIGLLIGRH